MHALSFLFLHDTQKTSPANFKSDTEMSTNEYDFVTIEQVEKQSIQNCENLQHLRPQE